LGGGYPVRDKPMSRKCSRRNFLKTLKESGGVTFSYPQSREISLGETPNILRGRKRKTNCRAPKPKQVYRKRKGEIGEGKRYRRNSLWGNHGKTDPEAVSRDGRRQKSEMNEE